MAAGFAGRRLHLLGMVIQFVFFSVALGPPTPIRFDDRESLGWAEAADDTPTPLLATGRPVDWWFVFKFNTTSFPGCGGGSGDPRVCVFGGTVQPYKFFGQQFVYASSEQPSLQKGQGCAGETTRDPLGACPSPKPHPADKRLIFQL